MHQHLLAVKEVLPPVQAELLGAAAVAVAVAIVIFIVKTIVS